MIVPVEVLVMIVILEVWFQLCFHCQLDVTTTSDDELIISSR